MTVAIQATPKAIPKAQRSACCWKYCRSGRVQGSVFCINHLELTVLAGQTNPYSARLLWPLLTMPEHVRRVYREGPAVDIEPARPRVSFWERLRGGVQ